MREREFTRAGDRELLKQACIMTDRADMLAQQIEEDGVILDVDGVPRPHPALKAELDARAFVTRTLVRLGVVGEPEKKKPIGRPATGAGCGITFEQLRELDPRR